MQEEAIDAALHLRHDSTEPWLPYKEFPQHFLPEPPKFSKGYATFVALLKRGWIRVSLDKKNS